MLRLHKKWNDFLITPPKGRLVAQTGESRAAYSRNLVRIYSSGQKAFHPTAVDELVTNLSGMEKTRTCPSTG